MVRVGTTRKRDKQDRSRGVNKIDLNYLWSMFTSRN